ncbi:hypothetical protein SAMN05421721_10351 [Ectothiorhodospira mobilis]|uniref:Uncharacterized protein n=2 Tax=Ectothiorhodospira mobilis TaxID=195064 RepID=A0A1I4Q137_ECTMO|nr:hypothetical protein SAMN05421721_10351 [Ectothiorhodospira mobilis]
MSSHDMEQDDAEQTVLLVMTSGPDTPARCGTPFYLGSVLAAMDARVHIFFTMAGVQLMRRGVAEELRAMEGGKRVIEFIRDAKRAGVILHVCDPALPGYGIDPQTDLIEEVDHVGRASDLGDLLLQADKVLSF